MKRIKILLIFFLLPVFGFEQFVSAQKGAPEITFEKMIYDYGTIEKNSDGTCEFIFKNTGKSPLILTNCKSTCGCTVPKCPQQPVMKGEKKKIVIKYNTKRIGSFTKTIIVYSNAKNSPSKLTIKGKVVSGKGGKKGKS